MQDKSDDAVIELSNFSFQMGSKQILRDVSFTVQEGEYLAIVGPNGAGKTTLVKCIDRILQGGSGRIAVRGKPLAHYSQKELARLVSYVPQADGRSLGLALAGAGRLALVLLHRPTR